MPFRYTHSCFHTSIGRLSSPGAVVPLAALRDRWISSSVMGCHGSSSGVEVGGLSQGVFISGKKESRKACAFSSFPVSSLVPTFSAGVHPQASRGFMYMAAFQSFPSPASSRNYLQCDALAFSMARVHARRFSCISRKSIIDEECSRPSWAQDSCHFRRSWLGLVC